MATRRDDPSVSPEAGDGAAPRGGAEWNLPALLARRHWDPRVLAARMRDLDYPISDSQAYRYAHAGPERFLELIATLCCALDCGVADLIVFAPEKRRDGDDRLDPPFRLPGT